MSFKDGNMQNWTRTISTVQKLISKKLPEGKQLLKDLYVSVGTFQVGKPSPSPSS